MTIIVNQHKSTALERLVILRVQQQKGRKQGRQLIRGNNARITTSSYKPQQKHRFETVSVKFYELLTLIYGLKRQTL